LYARELSNPYRESAFARLGQQTRLLICWLVNRAEAATSQRIRLAFGFADALPPNLYRLAEKRVRIGVGSIIGKA
jgi:hypothetical protein